MLHFLHMTQWIQFLMTWKTSFHTKDASKLYPISLLYSPSLCPINNPTSRSPLCLFPPQPTNKVVRNTPVSKNPMEGIWIEDTTWHQNPSQEMGAFGLPGRLVWVQFIECKSSPYLFSFSLTPCFL